MRGLVAVSIGVAMGFWTAGARAHDGHPGPGDVDPRSVVLAQAQAQTPAGGAAVKDAPGITGQAPYRFKVRIGESKMPE